MASLGARIRETASFASLDYLTLRDDAPAPVRAQATQQLRDLVMHHRAAGLRVLIVPLLLSYGGIEQGLRERLESLEYAIPDAALMPDERLVRWVLAMAGAG